MATLGTKTTYQCDNCLTTFEKNLGEVVEKVFEYKHIILESPYNLNTNKKTGKNYSYEYYVELEITIERGVGIMDSYHHEPVILCKACLDQLKSKLLK